MGKDPDWELTPMARQTSLFVTRLPNEMLLEIGKHLELHDKYLLSHVSRRLRSVFSQNWVATVNSLSLPDRQRFDAGLKLLRWDIYPCRMCAQFHGIMSPEPRSCSAAIFQEMEGFFRLSEGYVFRAIKLVRQFEVAPPAGPDFWYGKKSLRHFLKTRKGEFKVADRPSPSTATSRVVDGHLLVKMHYSYPSGGNQISWLKTYQGQICKHSRYLGKYLRPRPGWQGVRNGSDAVDGRTDLSFQDFIDLALCWSQTGEPPLEIHGSCPHCCTDYTVVAKEGQVHVHVYYDLGGEDFAHVLSWQKEWRLQRDRTKSQSRGSIRELWLSGKGVGWKDFC